MQQLMYPKLLVLDTCFKCAECKAMRVIFDSAESTDDIQDWMEKKTSESPHLPLLENNI